MYAGDGLTTFRAKKGEQLTTDNTEGEEAFLLSLVLCG